MNPASSTPMRGRWSWSLPPDDERQAWSRFSAGQLAKAYGDNEPEYIAADLRS